jgi:2,4'-dihydroxyacetophenone dioxygenase
MSADAADTSRMPYQYPNPPEALADIVVPDAVPQDERVWVPQAENVWFRPLCLNISSGYWMNLLRVRKAGVLSRHRHPGPVHGFVLKGRWRYLEHDWVATEGSYVFEPPGETHTLVVDEDVEEMITYFQVNGVMYYVDPWGKHTGYEDVFTKLDMCRQHYTAVGLGEDYVKRFIRLTAVILIGSGSSRKRLMPSGKPDAVLISAVIACIGAVALIVLMRKPGQDRAGPQLGSRCA